MEEYPFSYREMKDPTCVCHYPLNYNEGEGYYTYRGSKGSTLRRYGDHWELYHWADNTTDRIIYCPFCGRKLRGTNKVEVYNPDFS